MKSAMLFPAIGPSRRQFRKTPAGVLAFAIALVSFATTAWAQSNIDTDEHLTSPMPHRYIHGTLGDAKFQIALPDPWNGKFLMGTRGFSGTELSSGASRSSRRGFPSG